jgi:deoxyribonuclease-4
VKLGILVDSCHAFCAGYDFRQAEELARMVKDIDSTAGLERLHVLHVNDARDEAGSHRDRHAHIGKGKIGREGLRNLLSHRAFSRLPMILETPWESVATDRRNLRTVLSLL